MTFSCACAMFVVTNNKESIMSLLENLSPEKLKKLHTFKSDLLFRRLRHYNATHDVCKIYKLMHVINEEDLRFEKLYNEKQDQV